jgi:hypothetical protein
MRPLVAFFRENPQVLVLVVICLVFGLGMFLAVIFGLISAGHLTTNGEPNGTIVHLALVTRAVGI